LGKPVREIVAPVDTVMFCLSKGLGAPVGSMLAGTAEDIAQGRLYRKRLGGGMRQAGVLAAAGLIALEQSPRHLSEDHRNARLLARGLAGIPGIRIDPAKVQSNIVIFEVSGTDLAAGEISARLKQLGVLIDPIGAKLLRAVTHYDVDREGCELALAAMAEVAANASTAAV
jgi:threonine aldolase